MQVLFITLSRTDVLHYILSYYVEAGIKGATVALHPGLVAIRRLPLFGRLSHLTARRKEHRTIMTVIEEPSRRSHRIVENYVGDLDEPDTAVAFTVPVLFAGAERSQWHEQNRRVGLLSPKLTTGMVSVVGFSLLCDYVPTDDFSAAVYTPQ